MSVNQFQFTLCHHVDPDRIGNIFSMGVLAHVIKTNLMLLNMLKSFRYHVYHFHYISVM